MHICIEGRLGAGPGNAHMAVLSFRMLDSVCLEFVFSDPWNSFKQHPQANISTWYKKSCRERLLGKYAQEIHAPQWRNPSWTLDFIYLLFYSKCSILKHLCDYFKNMNDIWWLALYILNLHLWVMLCQTSTFPARSSLSDNWDMAGDPVVCSLILITSLMYFTVIRVESLRGAQHQSRSRDTDEPAAAPQPAPIKPREIQTSFLWHQLSSQNRQRTATEHHSW